MKITSAQNDIIKNISKLSNSAQARRKQGLIVLDGVHLCEEFLKKKGKLKQLFFTEKFAQHSEFTKFADLEVLIEIPESLMQKISPSKTPIGLLGIGKRNSLNDDNFSGQENFILILENIQDPGNLGSLLRSAVGFGVKGIFCEGCTDVFSPKVLRASMGAAFYTKIWENYGLENIREKFTGTICGTSLADGSQNIFEVNLDGQVAFILGNEGAGISEQAQLICDQLVKIPMANGFESLNVGTAGAIFCYEKFRCGY